jgi:hypothetical protein
LNDHSPQDIRTLLAGMEIVDPPGLVDAVDWAPASSTQAPARAPAHNLAEPGGRILAAVARMH